MATSPPTKASTAAETSVEEVLAFLLTWATPATSVVETVPLAAAHRRILAQDLSAPFALPNADNAAMDGYAFHSDALKTRANTVMLRVLGVHLAGEGDTPKVSAGECLKVMTGATLPSGSDTVIPHENVVRTGEWVSFPKTAVKPKANYRLRGEDIAVGQTLVQADTRISPLHLGLLGAMGYAEVPVFREPRVTLFSTGSEIYPPGTTLPESGLFDSNRYTLGALLETLPVRVDARAPVADRPETLFATLLDASKQSDFIITSGGVGAGDADHLFNVLSTLGEAHRWRVAMRPGKPLVVGRIDHCTVFALPGNPAAALAAFLQFVLPVLGRATHQASPPFPLCAKSVEPVHKKPGRTEYRRCMLTQNAEGAWQVRFGNQSVGVGSFLSANAVAMIPANSANLEAGTVLSVWPFKHPGS